MLVYSISPSSFSLIGTLTTEIYYWTEKKTSIAHKHTHKLKLILFPYRIEGRVKIDLYLIYFCITWNIVNQFNNGITAK